jgi:uncharacterized protein (DUF58 family)
MPTPAGSPAAAQRIPEFEYRRGWAGRGLLPGIHRSRMRGVGELFREYVPLQQFPDPRRLDLRAMARDPMEGVHVRVFERRTAIRLYLVADLSRSMLFAPEASSVRDWLLDLARSMAASAHAIGDRFGFVGAASAATEPAHWPAQRARSAAFEAIDALREIAPGRGAEGIADALHHLPRERALVFLASDFHWPAALLDEVLDGLGHHDCVPIWFRARQAFDWLPRWGLCRLEDLESGRSRLCFLRPRLRERVLAAARAHQRELERVFLSHGCLPCVMEGSFDADRLSAYFREA